MTQGSRDTITHSAGWLNLHWLWLSLIVIAVDQLTKVWAMDAFQLYETREIFAFLNLTLVHNTGAAFSILRGATPWLFVGLALLVTVGVVGWLQRHRHEDRLFAASLALIAGGAIGNAIDRAMHGHVIDFVDFHIGDWHYPAFNVADSAIVVGAVLIFIDMFFFSGRRKTG